MVEGLHLKSADGATLVYRHGELTLTRETTVTYRPIPFVKRKIEEVSVLKIDVSPDLLSVGGGLLIVATAKQGIFGRMEKPNIVTRVHFQDSIDA